MNSNFIRVVFMVDRSGSMELVRKEAISAFNGRLSGLRLFTSSSVKTDVKVILFDKTPHTMYDGSLFNVPFFRDFGETLVSRMPLSMADSKTALYECQLKAINELGVELAAMPEDQRPGQVKFITISDNLDTCSSSEAEASWREARAHQTEKYSWEFQDMVLKVDNQPSLVDETEENPITAKVVDAPQFDRSITPRNIGPRAGLSTHRSAPAIQGIPWFTVNADGSVNKE